MKAILTRYRPQTNTKPARVLATDSDGNKVMVNVSTYDSAEMAHDGAAISLCWKMNWSGKLASGGLGSDKVVYVWVSEAAPLIIIN